MAHLIKLELSKCLNLDHVIFTEWRLRGDDDKIQPCAYLSDGTRLPLSPKDLERIEKIAEETEYPITYSGKVPERLFYAKDLQKIEKVAEESMSNIVGLTPRPTDWDI